MVLLLVYTLEDTTELWNSCDHCLPLVTRAAKAVKDQALDQRVHHLAALFAWSQHQWYQCTEKNIILVIPAPKTTFSAHTAMIRQYSANVRQSSTEQFPCEPKMPELPVRAISATRGPWQIIMTSSRWVYPLKHRCRLRQSLNIPIQPRVRAWFVAGFGGAQMTGSAESVNPFWGADTSNGSKPRLRVLWRREGFIASWYTGTKDCSLQAHDSVHGDGRGTMMNVHEVQPGFDPAEVQRKCLDSFWKRPGLGGFAIGKSEAACFLHCARCCFYVFLKTIVILYMLSCSLTIVHHSFPKHPGNSPDMDWHGWILHDFARRLTATGHDDPSDF